ncbi:MAG: Ku protein [Methanosarcinales archaeon]|nr:Ku protein [Methanosarcinales archaeon]
MDEVALLEDQDKEEKGEQEVPILPRTVWSGSLSIGLVNIPVKALPITRDKRTSFRMLHRKCKTPISYRKFCQEGDEVSQSEIIYGYPLDRDRYLALEKKEIEAARPESSKVIDLDRFVNFFQIDPHHFDRTYLLIPDRSESAYALLKKVMEKTGKAAIGRMTISSREHVVLVHYYQKAIVATTLRYADEVLDPSAFQELKELPEPGEKEMELAMEIVNRLTGDLDLSVYHDRYRERIDALVASRVGREVVEIRKKARPRREARDLMAALKETARSLK